MRIIDSSVEILDELDGLAILKKIEAAGRTCYKSEGKITEYSCEKFIKDIIVRGHESVLEHASISMRFVCDRGVSHEIVRHRLASFSQESTRYCNYERENFGSEITVIRPSFWDIKSAEYSEWEIACRRSEQSYFTLLRQGATPQEARSVLPNSLKTELVMTCNIRELRHFLKLRTSRAAHPQMRELAIKLLNELLRIVPELFYDIKPLS